ncbi:Ubiquitin carboxyl-terminal hydrolase 5 [Vitis vinifera]|uniref:Ubiquitin carboxyl-terminal hydrolase 5 n=1 Tax=Vitis vinifera TaxID=29760 RepID=A0A438FB11_VITVI|nr:Ubiquitin carboxyl-terminal hydrolase 5 [Vitis vinifera]
MKLRLLSWNVREANDSSKRKVIKAMIRSQRVDLFCIQEMKIQTMSEGVVRSLGSGRLKNVEDGLVWIFNGVYGPFTRKERETMWEELGAIRGIWDDPWCLGDDFNATLSQRERSSQGSLNGAMRRGVAQSRLPRPTSDHFPILLKGGGLSRGPSLFRFENMWLKVDGFKDLLRDWWQGAGRRGRANFRLAAKLKVLKEKIKVWNRDVFEREMELKNEAKETFKKWVLLEETHWRQSSRELWLKEGDKNTGFFHRMSNAHWRNNSLDSIKINGVELAEEQEAREGIEEVVELFKEFYDQKSFAKSLNTTFLVLIPKKGGAKDLGDFRPINLLGGLYKLLTKVLTNRLKKVLGKVVLADQNAFLRGRQILDASLIANEVVDYWQKRKEKGLVCKLDIEKAYDSINWNFLMKVLHKMDFGSRWMEWIWWCISTAKFSVLVNGVPAGFFSSSKGLRASNSSWLDLAWFEAASGLRINLAKSELIPVGEVEDIEVMTVELGCKVGDFPVKYLGLPLEPITKPCLCGMGVIGVKYGQEGCGWRTNEARGTFGVGVWKEILKEASWCWDNIEFKVGRGTKVKFWTDHWCGNTVLSQKFPKLYAMTIFRNATVNEVDFRISSEEDSVLWKGGGLDIFRIRDAYNLLAAPNPLVFPKKSIWVDKVPTKVAFFAWEATWEKILTVLWEIVLALFGAQWVFLEIVKEGVFGRGVLFAFWIFGVVSGSLRAGEGQYKSTLVCPVCNKISVTFDPFMYLSLPLQSTITRTMTVTVFTCDGSALPSACTVTVPKQGRCRDLIQALSGACSVKHNEKLLLAEIRNHLIDRFLEDPLILLSTIKDDDHLAAYKIPKLSKSTIFLQLIHRREEQEIGNAQKSFGWKPYGTPLVSPISCDDVITRGDIQSIVYTMLSPMLRTERQGHTDISETSISVAASDPSCDITTSEAFTDSIESDLKDMDGNSYKTVTLSKLPLQLVDENNACIDLSVGEEKPIKLSSSSMSILVFVDWSHKFLEKYDTHYLENLPEVFKYGPVTKKARTEPLSLYTCLEAFLREEPLVPEDMWFCPQCKEQRQASKKLDLWRLPEVLVIHLKRFSYSRSMKHKLETFVNFPIHDLDLTNYVAHKNNSRSQIYELYALTNHYGGMGSGHYTAHIKVSDIALTHKQKVAIYLSQIQSGAIICPLHSSIDIFMTTLIIVPFILLQLLDENRWYNFDDSHISAINEEDVKSAAAYVLFYKRVKIDDASVSNGAQSCAGHENILPQN